MAMAIQRQADHFLGGRPRKESCEACGQWGELRRHATLGQDYCANCTEAANSLNDLTSGPSIQVGFNR